MPQDPRRETHRGLHGKSGLAAPLSSRRRRRRCLLRLGQAAPPHGAAGEAAVALGGDPPLVEGETGHEPGRLNEKGSWELR